MKKNRTGPQPRLSSNDIKSIAKFVKEKLFVQKSKQRKSIFLCGADIKNKSTARHRMAEIFAEHPNYEIHYPEGLFDDLLFGEKQYNLLSLENILAQSVDAIIIFPESPGSLVELGAFANHSILAKKIICLPEKKHKDKKSFINYGPIRLIKSSKPGRVIPINYDDLSTDDGKHKIYTEIDSAVTKIRQKLPSEKGLTNILETDGFVLSVSYLVDHINSIDLYKIFESATKEGDKYEKGIGEVAIRSGIAKLIENNLISQNPEGYSITKRGVAQIRERFKRSALDAARSELLNKLTRRNATVKYDRMISGASP